MAIITFFEGIAQPLREGWYSGGWVALLAAVLASPVLMFAIRLLFAYFSVRSTSKKARRRKALAAVEAEKLDIANLFNVIEKELPNHEDT